MSIEVKRDSECVKKSNESKNCLRKSGKVQTWVFRSTYVLSIAYNLNPKVEPSAAVKSQG